mmetsp:Transcript_69018/g.159937  ORF Transcript_69018/g.159937 Transcript_69018/m.159937 type:complete len:132 (-) Transcript_69018:38-433(-)
MRYARACESRVLNLTQPGLHTHLLAATTLHLWVPTRFSALWGRNHWPSGRGSMCRKGARCTSSEPTAKFHCKEGTVPDQRCLVFAGNTITLDVEAYDAFYNVKAKIQFKVVILRISSASSLQHHHVGCRSL